MIVLGLIVALAVAGTIEGFVTGSGLPTFFRVGLGSWSRPFWLYIVTQGRIAAATGSPAVERGRRGDPVEAAPPPRHPVTA